MPDLDATIIGISRGRPRWPLPFSDRRLDALAPDDLTRQMEDLGDFEASYTRQLEELGADRILSDLGRIADGKAAVMLCWEKLADLDEYCHRRTVADYLERKAGLVVPELAPGNLPQRPDVATPRLF